jgi:hypothetical protein
VNQQRGRRQPVITVTECAVLGMGSNNVGDELAQAVEHKVLPKSMKPRERGRYHYYMSRKLNRRNVRQFRARHYVSAIWER